MLVYIKSVPTFADIKRNKNDMKNINIIFALTFCFAMCMAGLSESQGMELFSYTFGTIGFICLFGLAVELYYAIKKTF